MTSERPPIIARTAFVWSKRVGPLKRCKRSVRSCVSGVGPEPSAVEEVRRVGSGESKAAGSEVGNGAGAEGNGDGLKSRRLGETATRGSTSLNVGIAAAGPKRLATSVGGGGERSGSLVGLRAGVSESVGAKGLFA